MLSARNANGREEGLPRSIDVTRFTARIAFGVVCISQAIAQAQSPVAPSPVAPQVVSKEFSTDRNETPILVIGGVQRQIVTFHSNSLAHQVTLERSAPKNNSAPDLPRTATLQAFGGRPPATVAANPSASDTAGQPVRRDGLNLPSTAPPGIQGTQLAISADGDAQSSGADMLEPSEEFPRTFVPRPPTFSMVGELTPPTTVTSSTAPATQARELAAPGQSVVALAIPTRVASLDPPSLDPPSLEDVGAIELAPPAPPSLSGTLTFEETLPIEEWASESALLAPRYKLADLTIPKAYRSRVEKAETQPKPNRNDSPANKSTSAEDTVTTRQNLAPSLSYHSVTTPTLQSAIPNAWNTDTRTPMLRYERSRELTLSEAIHTVIRFAPGIEVLRTEVVLDDAETVHQRFGTDWSRFIECKWDEPNSSIGATSHAVAKGLEHRSLEHQSLEHQSRVPGFATDQSNHTGGRSTLAEDLGPAVLDSRLKSKSFITPTFVLEYREPSLVQEASRATVSRIHVGIVDPEYQEHELIATLQNRILSVARAYWELVANRGEFTVRSASYNRAFDTASTVTRDGYTIDNSVQHARAEATLSMRRAAVLSAEYTVVLAQEKLLRQIFGPEFEESVDTEIIPISVMRGSNLETDTKSALQVALQNRSEVVHALQQIHRVAAEQGLPQNQLLPMLAGSLALATSSNPQRNTQNALPQSDPLAMQIQKQFDGVVSKVAAQACNAVHRIALAAEQLSAARNASSLAERELGAIERTADSLLDRSESGPLHLDDLLQTQDRLAQAELACLAANSSYALAQFELQRANGCLLKCLSLPYVTPPATNTMQANSATSVYTR